MLRYCVYIKSNVQFISPRHSWFPREMTSESRNSILMTCHYPDLGSASVWLNEIFNQSEVLPRPG